jgi:hypothetical protein
VQADHRFAADRRLAADDLLLRPRAVETQLLDTTQEATHLSRVGGELRNGDGKAHALPLYTLSTERAAHPSGPRAYGTTERPAEPVTSIAPGRNFDLSLLVVALSWSSSETIVPALDMARTRSLTVVLLLACDNA